MKFKNVYVAMTQANKQHKKKHSYIHKHIVSFQWDCNIILFLCRRKYHHSRDILTGVRNKATKKLFDAEYHVSR